ncbi:MAG: hypothetical protein WCD81_00490 [Candidatus Bathyarchaeia archaeon]
MKTQIIMIAVLSAILLALPITTHVAFAQTGPYPPILSIVNPGPSSNPSKWNASSDAADLGTSNFTFNSNDIGSTFFVNLTIATNATASLYGWGAGLVFDNTTLQYVNHWLPSDNVFSGAVAAASDVLIPAFNIDIHNDTYQILECGCGYAQGSPEWSFNGTGTLMQIEFKIIAQLNSTTPEVNFGFSFDPAWSGDYYWPSGSDVPQLETGLFTLTAAPPTMGTPTQTPDQYTVQPGEPVYVGINVTDPTGVQNVTLSYTNDTTWYDLPMTFNSTNSLYETHIPGFANGTTVTYNITAFNQVGIEGVQDNNTLNFAYTVVPEFPILTLPIIFAALSLAAGVIVLSRKRRTVPK